MRRKIFKTGHSLAITVTKKMLEALDLKMGDSVNLELHEEKSEIVVKKTKSNSQLDLGLKLRHKLGESAAKGR